MPLTTWTMVCSRKSAGIWALCELWRTFGTSVAEIAAGIQLMFDSTTPVVRILSHGPYAGARKRTVLIVEDHLDSREILSTFFKSRGHTVLEADDAKEALRLISDTHMDLIVTDFGLPEMDGLEFVTRARGQRCNQRDLKIALLTAYDPADYLDSALKAGCDLVLAKPIDLNKFDRLIRLLPEQSGSHKVGTYRN